MHQPAQYWKILLLTKDENDVDIFFSFSIYVYQMLPTLRYIIPYMCFPKIFHQISRIPHSEYNIVWNWPTTEIHPLRNLLERHGQFCFLLWTLFFSQFCFTSLYVSSSLRLYVTQSLLFFLYIFYWHNLRHQMLRENRKFSITHKHTFHIMLTNKHWLRHQQLNTAFTAPSPIS